MINNRKLTKLLEDTESVAYSANRICAPNLSEREKIQLISLDSILEYIEEAYKEDINLNIIDYETILM